MERPPVSQHMHRPLGWGGASSGVTVLCRLHFPEGSLRVQNKQCLIRQLLIQGPPRPTPQGWLETRGSLLVLGALQLSTHP